MGNSLRCCLACVLPCGSLDLIRIVHLSGHVEEISRPVTAGDILNANPSHVLSKPCSESTGVRRILILSPDDELERGSIYFLIPDPSLQGNKKPHAAAERRRRGGGNCYDRFFSEAVVVPEKKSKSSRRYRRSRGQISNWTPRLASICEDLRSATSRSPSNLCTKDLISSSKNSIAFVVDEVTKSDF